MATSPLPFPIARLAELKLFIDNLPELAWTARPDGHVDFFHRRWLQYTGTTLADVQGFGWQKLLDGAQLPMVAERKRSPFLRMKRSSNPSGGAAPRRVRSKAARIAASSSGGQ